MRRSPMWFLSIWRWTGLGRVERGCHDVDRDPDRVDHDRIRSLEGVDQLRGPQVLECDEQGRAVRGEVVTDLLGVLRPERTRLRDVDSEEGRAFLVDVRSLERRHGAVCILHHEEEIKHSNRAVLHELQDRRGYPPGELVARKTDDVHVYGADCHDVSLLGLRLRELRSNGLPGPGNGPSFPAPEYMSAPITFRIEGVAPR